MVAGFWRQIDTPSAEGQNLRTAAREWLGNKKLTHRVKLFSPSSFEGHKTQDCRCQVLLYYCKACSLAWQFYLRDDGVLVVQTVGECFGPKNLKKI